MKRLKRIVSILLAMVMVLGMGITAFADGNDGSITINGSAGNGQEGTEVSVAGKTFTAYQILTAEMAGNTAEDGVIYRVPDALKGFYANYFDLPLSTNGDVLVSQASFDQDVTEKIAALNAEELQLFAEEALKAAKAANVFYKTATAGNEDKSVTIDSLPLGYYVVEDEGAARPISALALTTTVKDASVKIKASQPVIDKNINGTTDTDPETVELVKYNNTSIGDKVPYVVDTSVPDMTGYKKYYFIVNDTLSKGLTFNNDVVITMPGVTALPDVSTGDAMAVVDKVLEVGKDYTVTATAVKNAEGNETGETAIEIVFKDFIQYKNMEGAPIVITYSATVNKDAIIGIAGNPNKVTLQYSNKPNVEPDSDPDNPDKPGPDAPVGTTPESVTYTYITGLELTKVDEAGKYLTGAEFEIAGNRLNKVLISGVRFEVAADGTYYKLKDGTYTTTDPIENTVSGGDAIPGTGTEDLYESTTIKYEKVPYNTVETKAEEYKVTAIVDENGKVKFEGLGAGMYTITELKAPNGYNLLKNPITVKIECAVPETGATSTNCTWTAIYTLDELNASQLDIMSNNTIEDLKYDTPRILGAGVEIADLTFGTAVFTLDVVNQSGLLLPSTGGIGTTIFTIGGCAKMIVAAGLFFATRRKAEK